MNGQCWTAMTTATLTMLYQYNTIKTDMIILRTIKQRNFFSSLHQMYQFISIELNWSAFSFFSLISFLCFFFVSNIFVLCYLLWSIKSSLEEKKKWMECTQTHTAHSTVKADKYSLCCRFYDRLSRTVFNINTMRALTTNYGYGYDHAYVELNDSSNVTKRRAKQIYKLHRLAQAQAPVHSCRHTHTHTRSTMCTNFIIIN